MINLLKIAIFREGVYMFKTLRILFTVLAVILLVPIVPIGAFWGLIPALLLAGGALVSFLLVLFFKGKQEHAEEKKNAKPKGDFFNPLEK